MHLVNLVNNEPEQIEIRKSQNTLIVVGTGTILFGVWTMVKMVGLLFLLRDETIADFRSGFSDLDGISDAGLFWGTVALTFIISAMALAARAYIGMSAISEGRGKRRSIVYLLITGIMIVLGIWSLGTDLANMGSREQLGALTASQSLTASIIEATSLIMMTEMVISSLKIRKLTRRKDTGREAESAS